MKLIQRLTKLEQASYVAIKYPPFSLFFESKDSNIHWMLENNKQANPEALKMAINSIIPFEDMYENT